MKSIEEYEPKTNIVSFADLYGYDHKVEGTKLSLTKGNKVVSIDFGGLNSTTNAVITSGGNSDSLAMCIKDDNYYGDLLVLHEYIAKDTELKELDYKELISRGNKALVPILVGSIAGGLLLVGGIAIAIVLIKKKAKKIDTEST